MALIVLHSQHLSESQIQHNYHFDDAASDVCIHFNTRNDVIMDCDPMADPLHKIWII